MALMIFRLKAYFKGADFLIPSLAVGATGHPKLSAVIFRARAYFNRKKRMDEQKRIVDAARADKNPIQTLENEHRTILVKLELMERALGCLQKGPEEDAPERVETEKELLKELVAALERELGLHFQKEEEALFPILAEYVGKEHGPIEVMFHEHQKIRSVLDTWGKIFPVFCEVTRPVGMGMLKAILKSGFEAIHLIRQHFSKENQILFRICETSLSEEEKRRVMEKMKTMSMDPLKKGSGKPKM